MSASGNTWLHFRMEEEYYKELEEHHKQQIEIVKVEVENIDYSKDELWNKLKSASVKAYKKLKEREYNLRLNK